MAQNLSARYEVHCRRNGLLPLNKVRNAFLGAFSLPRKLQFSNLQKELNGVQWNVVTAVFAELMEDEKGGPGLPSDVVEVQMNALGAGDVYGALLLEALLSRMPSVEMLGDELGTASARIIAAAIAKPNTAVRRLKLGDNLLTQHDMGTLAKPLAMPTCTLQQLHLAENPIGDGGAVHLAAALLRNRTLTSLCLRDTHMTPRGIGAIAEALTSSLVTELCELDVKKNDLGDEGTEHIAAILRLCPKLTILDISQVGMTEEGCHALARAVQMNCTLRHLILSNNHVGDRAMVALCKSVGRPLSYISALHADDCYLTHKCSEGIRHLLENAVCLRRLSLGDNALGDEGARALAHGVRHVDSRLLQLNIPRCRVGPGGLSALLHAVRTNASLRSVDISQNHLGNGGAAVNALRTMLEGNSSIVRLHFSDNGLSYESTAWVAESLKKNHAIRNCVFGGQSENANLISSEQRGVINDTLRRNKVTAASKGKSHWCDDTAERENSATTTEEYLGRSPSPQDDVIPGILPRALDFEASSTTPSPLLLARTSPEPLTPTMSDSFDSHYSAVVDIVPTRLISQSAPRRGSPEYSMESMESDSHGASSTSSLPFPSDFLVRPVAVRTNIDLS